MDNIKYRHHRVGLHGVDYSEAIVRDVKGATLFAIAGGQRALSLAAEHGVTTDPTVDAPLCHPDVDSS